MLDFSSNVLLSDEKTSLFIHFVGAKSEFSVFIPSQGTTVTY